MESAVSAKLWHIAASRHGVSRTLSHDDCQPHVSQVSQQCHTVRSQPSHAADTPADMVIAASGRGVSRTLSHDDCQQHVSQVSPQCHSVRSQPNHSADTPIVSVSALISADTSHVCHTVVLWCRVFIKWLQSSTDRPPGLDEFIKLELEFIKYEVMFTKNKSIHI